MRTIILIFAMVCVSAAGCRQKNLDAISSGDAAIELISSASGIFLNRPSKLIRLKITENDLPSREVEVRIVPNKTSAKGALILTTGGFGDTFYATGPGTTTTLDFAYTRGLEIFEVRWLGNQGWGTSTAGAGYPRAVRAFGDIVRWLKRNEMSNPAIVVAHGGSGGSFQIAYGLSRYNLEQDIDHAILIAGPPTADLNRGIFGVPTDPSRWPDGLGGFRITDYIHGWENNGDHCVNRNRQPPASVTEALNRSSLLSTIEQVKLSYRTKVFFVNSNDVTHADEQGKLYYDAITSEKEWHFLPNETSHSVAGLPSGAIKIREIIARIVL